jgi:xanthine dehydrogenase accessory factor
MPNDDYYLNPVCNIPIQKSTAKYVLEYNNEKVYFCCDGCKVKFEKDPEKYMAETAES